MHVIHCKRNDGSVPVQMFHNITGCCKILGYNWRDLGTDIYRIPSSCIQQTQGAIFQPSTQTIGPITFSRNRPFVLSEGFELRLGSVNWVFMLWKVILGSLQLQLIISFEEEQFFGFDGPGFYPRLDKLGSVIAVMLCSFMDCILSHFYVYHFPIQCA